MTNITPNHFLRVFIPQTPNPIPSFTTVNDNDNIRAESPIFIDIRHEAKELFFRGRLADGFQQELHLLKFVAKRSCHVFFGKVFFFRK